MQRRSGRNSGAIYPRLARTEAAYRRLAGTRDSLLAPLTKLLGRAGLSADLVSLASVAAMVPVLLLARDHPWLAVGCGILSTLADQLDGALARQRGEPSDRGKLLDMVCDNLAFTLYVIALVRFEMAAPIPGLVLAYTMVVSKTLRTLLHAAGLRSDWLFRPVAGFLPNAAAAVMYLGYVPYAVAGLEVFTPLAWALSAVLALDACWTLRRLLRVRLTDDDAPAPQ